MEPGSIPSNALAMCVAPSIEPNLTVWEGTPVECVVTNDADAGGEC